MKRYLDHYRALTQSEINALEHQGCVAEDWARVHVGEQFTTDRCVSARFSGEIYLAHFDSYIEMPGGVRKPTGIYSAHLHNCSLAPNVLIDQIGQYIAGYSIGERTCISSVDRLVVSARSSFGNGVRVSVLNETGGREVPITDHLTAQIAYLCAFYRHDSALITALETLSERYTERITSDTGEIGRQVEIRSCHTIDCVRIGDGARIVGASRLYNGSILSQLDAPIFIGYNVVAEDFILHSGSRLDTGATIGHCLVGQGTCLKHLFSAHDSLFFANCQGENGEACAVFAGPYTVTMHKSSLLIAGYFSFLNAGSGSNQSNHQYKLGPIHQGIVERGSKTTSGSYVLWPAHIGPFSLVMGRHVHHVDSSDFPFSYLIEQHNQTYLTPAINIRSVGTIRDAKKWPARDKRPENLRQDCVNYNLLSPYTVGKMLRGSEILRQLRDMLGNSNQQEVVYRNMHIRGASLERGLNLYRLAIVKFLGNSLITRLQGGLYTTDEEVQARLTPELTEGLGRWVDLCGLLAPEQEVSQLLSGIKTGAFDSLEAVAQVFIRLHERYYDLEWPWAYDQLCRWYGVEPGAWTIDKVLSVVAEWEEAVVQLDKMLYEDARKEFDMSVQVSFGIDRLNAQDKRQEEDFINVRGRFDDNPFVEEVLSHIERKQALATRVRAQFVSAGGAS